MILSQAKADLLNQLIEKFVEEHVAVLSAFGMPFVDSNDISKTGYASKLMILMKDILTEKAKTASLGLPWANFDRVEDTRDRVAIILHFIATIVCAIFNRLVDIESDEIYQSVASVSALPYRAIANKLKMDTNPVAALFAPTPSKKRSRESTPVSSPKLGPAAKAAADAMEVEGEESSDEVEVVGESKAKRAKTAETSPEDDTKKHSIDKPKSSKKAGGAGTLKKALKAAASKKESKETPAAPAAPTPKLPPIERSPQNFRLDEDGSYVQFTLNGTGMDYEAVKKAYPKRSKPVATRTLLSADGAMLEDVDSISPDDAFDVQVDKDFKAVAGCPFYFNLLVVDRRDPDQANSCTKLEDRMPAKKSKKSKKAAENSSDESEDDEESSADSDDSDAEEKEQLKQESIALTGGRVSTLLVTIAVLRKEKDSEKGQAIEPKVFSWKNYNQLKGTPLPGCDSVAEANVKLRNMVNRVLTELIEPLQSHGIQDCFTTMNELAKFNQKVFEEEGTAVVCL